MAVSAVIRREDEIDAKVRSMPPWRCAREPVIRAALHAVLARNVNRDRGVVVKNLGPWV
jgi:hypothetical protein